ncbi:MAG TPA: hypothetical protein VKA38_01375 [Draconibacterium sp.]|nr:hypothetical protein [Draconibacterium sp.]
MIKKAFIPIIFLLFSQFVFSQQMKLEIDGNITFDNSMYYITEAGNDFPSSIETETSIYISVSYDNFWDKKFNPNQKWRLYINKTDVNWNPDLILEVIRTGDGNHPGNRGKTNIHDGTNYHNISNNPAYFFRGKDEISDIPISFRIIGLSITMGAQEYETNIVMTIYDD